MVCPFCFNKRTSVYNSRPTKRLNGLWRRRRCEACGQQFTTREVVEPSTVLTVSEGTSLTPFSQARLLISLARACEHRNDDAAYWLAETVAQQLLQVHSQRQAPLDRATIREVCLVTLHNFDMRAFMKYFSEHADESLDDKTLRKQLKKP